MTFKLRAENITPAHVTFALFANGANCGVITLRVNEAQAFAACLQRGCEGLGVTFALEDYELN